MGGIKSFKDKLLCIDTSPFIYFIENHKFYSKFLRQLFLNVDNGNIRIVTSTITLLEVLVHPYRNKRFDLTEHYEAVLTGSPGVELISINAEIAKEAAEIRAKYNLLTPDAIQVAVAQHTAADFFITNDKRLAKIKIPKVLILDGLV